MCLLFVASNLCERKKERKMGNVNVNGNSSSPQVFISLFLILLYTDRHLSYYCLIFTVVVVCCLLFCLRFLLLHYKDMMRCMLLFPLIHHHKQLLAIQIYTMKTKFQLWLLGVMVVVNKFLFKDPGIIGIQGFCFFETLLSFS